MTTTKTLTRWQTATTLATEGACLLPYITTLPVALWLTTRPPHLFTNLQGYLPLLALCILYGGIKAPLRLWRTAVYARLCAAADTLPSLALPRGTLSAISWRWQLWWRRAATLALAVAPSALLWSYGTTLANRSAQTQPLLWLLFGGLALLGGLAVAVLWQARYALAPVYLLRGYPAGAAIALSVKAMRRHTGDYINFLGGEASRLLPCLLLIPAVWLLPAFRRRHTALLLSWA